MKELEQDSMESAYKLYEHIANCVLCKDFKDNEVDPTCKEGVRLLKIADGV